MAKARKIMVAPEEVKVRRWQFCPQCKGQKCPSCGGRGQIVEVIPLADIPRRLRGSFARAQQDFLQEQLNTRSTVTVLDIREDKPLVEVTIRE